MFRRSVLLCALSGPLLLTLTACGEKAIPSSPPQATLVRVEAVRSASMPSRSFSGTVAARVQSDLGFRVAGKVVERLVDAGQAVQRGQALMRIDPIDLRLTETAQREAVSAATARAKQAVEEELRYRDLVGDGAVSASAYDQVKAAADAATAQLSAAQAQASVARNASNYAVLLADADGVVVETAAEPGQVVGAGQMVVRLAHAGRREAVVQLPETLRPALGSLGQATLYGRHDPPTPARLRQLSDAADRLTRTFEARYVLEGPLSTAPLGATVTLQIPEKADGPQAGLQVPIGAIFDPGKGAGVWVIEGSQVKWRAVAVLGVADDVVRISGALNAGDNVVALGAHLLKEGQQVRLDAVTIDKAAARGAQK